MALSLFEIRRLMNPDKPTEITDDFRIIRTWTEYKDVAAKSPEKRPLNYLCYELEMMNPYTGERKHVFKAIKFVRVVRLPASAKQSTSFMNMQEKVLTSVYEGGYNFITVIANIIKPKAALLFLYGVQGVARNIDDAKLIADRNFEGFIRAMQGKFRVLEMRVLIAEQAEWLREKLYHMDYMTVVRGIPWAEKAAEDGGNKGVGASNVNPDSQGTLEDLILGMVNYEYILEVLTTPVSKSTLDGWFRRSQESMTSWYSKLQGTKSLNMNVALPMMYMSNVGVANGWNRGYSNGRTTSFARGTSFSTSQGQSAGQSLSQSFGRSVGRSAGSSFSSSYTQGLSHTKGVSFGETFGESKGFSNNYSYGQTHGTSQNISQSIGRSTSENVSFGQTHGVSVTRGQSFGTSQGLGLSSGRSQNIGASLSNGFNASNSHSVSNGTSFNISKGQSSGISHSLGQGRNFGISQNQSVSQGMSASYGQSANRGVSQSFSDSYGVSENSGWSHGQNASASRGFSANTGGSASQNDSYSVGENHGTTSGKSENSSFSLNASFGIGVNGGHSWGSSSGTSDGYSSGESHSSGYGLSYSNGESASQSLGESLSSTGSTGLSHTQGASFGSTSSFGESVSRGASMSASQGFGFNQGVSANESYSTNLGSSLSQSFGANRGVSDSASLGQSLSYGQTMGSGITSGVSQNIGTSQGQSLSVGESLSNSVSHGYGVSNSESLSRGYGVSDSESFSRGYGESQSASHSQNFGRSESVGVSESLGQSVGKTTGVSASQSASLGYGQNIGRTEGISNGQSSTTSNGETSSLSSATTGSTSLATGASLGVSPSIGFNTSYQWLNQGVKDLLEMMEYNNTRIKKSLQGNGAFFTYVYIGCPSLSALAAAQAVAKSTWNNEFALTHPLQILDLSESEQKHLLYKFCAFSGDITRESIAGMQQYKYCTVLLPEDAVAYTHPPRVSEGGIFSIVQDVPKFSVPSSFMEGEIYMGTVLNPERYDFETGYLTHTDYRIPESMLMHGCVTGASRSGKTVAAMRFVAELSRVRRNKTGKRLRIVVMDPKQDWRALARFVEPERFHFYSMANKDFMPIKLNVWKIPMGVLPQLWVDGLIDIYCRAYGLMERGKIMIAKVVFEEYAKAGVWEINTNEEGWKQKVHDASSKVCFNNIYKRFVEARDELLALGGRSGPDTVDAYQRLVERLSCFGRDYSIESILYGTTEGVCIDDLIGDDDVTVLESKGLENTFSSFIFGAITSGFYKYAFSHDHGFLAKDQYETVLVIEEANEVLTGTNTNKNDISLPGQSEFEKILDQSAGYGLFIIAITQRISLMPTSIVANMGILFAGRQREKSDVEIVVRSIGREERIDDRDTVKWFPRSPTGWFVIQTSRARHFTDADPVLVYIAQLNVNQPSNDELRQLMLQREFFSAVNRENDS